MCGVLYYIRVARARRAFRVVDVGCATGTTLVALLARGFTDVHGVEASRPMLAGVRARARLVVLFGKKKGGGLHAPAL